MYGWSWQNFIFRNRIINVNTKLAVVVVALAFVNCIVTYEYNIALVTYEYNIALVTYMWIYKYYVFIW